MKKIAVGLAVLAIRFGLPVWATTYYASPAGGGDGSSSESPTTLADAVAQATLEGTGAVVQLSAETFEMTAETTIAADITVRGAGRDQTIVTRKSGSIRLFTLNSAGAVLKDMTVQNGAPGGKFHGGNILITEGSVENCIVQGAKSGQNGYGGTGIAVHSSKSPVRITNCIIRNNTANIGTGDNSGAALMIYRSTGSVRVEGCVFYGNRAIGQENGFAGAASIYVDPPVNDTVISHCTFANEMGPGVGAIYSHSTNGDNKPIVRDCLFYRNAPRRNTAQRNDLVGYFKSVDHCAFEQKTTSVTCTDCVEGVMYFVDPENGDYTPLSYANVAVGAASDGTDIGALQHDAAKDPDCAFSCDLTAPHAVPATANFTAVGNGADGFVWDFGDGAGDSGADVSHVYTTPGTYTPKVKLGSGDWHVGAPIVVTPAAFSVSTVTELTAALAAAGDGTVITVAKGDYEFSSGTTLDYFSVTASALLVQKGVKIRGATGNPDDVVFYVKGNTMANRTNSSRTKLRLVFLDHPDAELSSIALRYASLNGVRYYGAGCFVDYHGGTVSNCSFTGCSCFNNAGGGAAIGMYGGLATHCWVTNNYSKLNSNDNDGASVLLYGSATVRNSLVAGNESEAAAGQTSINTGGVRMYGESTLESCTVAGNTSLGPGGVRQETSTCVVRNCVMQGNTSSGTSYDEFQAADITKFINCAVPESSKAKFESADGKKKGVSCQKGAMPVENAVAGDWRPVFGSVALENGAPQPWMDGAKALNGEDRLSSDGKVDIGAYQFKKSSVNGSFTPFPLEGVVPLDVSFTAEASSTDGDIVGYLWDFGDGSEVVQTTAPSTTHRYEEMGKYAPSLRVVIGDKQYPIAYSGTITSGPAVLYVTNEAKDEDGAWPYADWDEATTNLKTAIGAALKGSRIVLRRGVHTNGFDVVVDKDITIEGETENPSDTTVFRLPPPSDGVSGHACRVFDLAAEGATIRNLTMAGGSIVDNITMVFGADLRIQSAGGTVSNCVLTAGYIGKGPSNSKLFNGSCGAAAAVSGGLLTHCVVTGNVAYVSSNDGGAGAGIIRQVGGRVEYCLVANNTVNDSYMEGDKFSSVLRVTGGSLANCTVVSNDVSRGWTVSAISGTTSFGRIANCLIACNRSANPDVAYAAVCNNDGTAGSMSHCAGDRETGKAGVLFAEDMKFVDPANGDWRVHYESVAAKNADTSVIRATRDLAGAPTVYLRNKADIGCYSRIDKPGTLLLVK